MYELGSKSEKRVDVDLMIHLGMHPDEEGYFVEKRARVLPSSHFSLEFTLIFSLNPWLAFLYLVDLVEMGTGGFL